MAFNRDITSIDVSTHGVVSCPDRMTGTAQQNKQRFDELVREVVKEKFNGLIDDLEASTAAGNIGFSSEGFESTNVKAAIEEATEIAEEYAEDAKEEALVSEGWAVGKQNGVDVPQSSPYYHNNAKYYKDNTIGGTLLIRYDTSHSDCTKEKLISAINNRMEVLVRFEFNLMSSFSCNYYKLTKLDISEGNHYLCYFYKENGGGCMIDLEQYQDEDTLDYFEEIYSEISKTNLSSDVRTSLNKADTALQTHQDISGKEDKGKVTIGGVSYDIEITNVDPGVGTAGKIIIVTG